MWRVLKCSEWATFGAQKLVKDSIPVVSPDPGGRWGDYCDTVMDYSRSLVAWGHGEWHDSNIEWKSQIARYVTTCSSDWNQDGSINAIDDATVIELYLEGNTAIDINGNEWVEPQDLQAVLELQDGG